MQSLARAGARLHAVTQLAVPRPRLYRRRRHHQPARAGEVPGPARHHVGGLQPGGHHRRLLAHHQPLRGHPVSRRYPLRGAGELPAARPVRAQRPRAHPGSLRPRPLRRGHPLRGQAGHLRARALSPRRRVRPRRPVLRRHRRHQVPGRRHLRRQPQRQLRSAPRGRRLRRHLQVQGDRRLLRPDGLGRLAEVCACVPPKDPAPATSAAATPAVRANTAAIPAAASAPPRAGPASRFTAGRPSVRRGPQGPAPQTRLLRGVHGPGP